MTSQLHELLTTGGLNIETWTSPNDNDRDAGILAYRTVLQWDGDSTTEILQEMGLQSDLWHRHMRAIEVALASAVKQARWYGRNYRILVSASLPFAVLPLCFHLYESVEWDEAKSTVIIAVLEEMWSPWMVPCVLPISIATISRLLRYVVTGRIPDIIVRLPGAARLLPEFGSPTLIHEMENRK